MTDGKPIKLKSLESWLYQLQLYFEWYPRIISSISIYHKFEKYFNNTALKRSINDWLVISYVWTKWILKQ